MKTFFMFLAACTPVFGGEEGIKLFSSSTTNAETSSVSKTVVFTRDGQTNLVRSVRIRGGAVQVQVHRFYLGGKLVADFIAVPASSGFFTEAGSPYSSSLEFDSSKNVKTLLITTKDGLVAEAYTCAEGYFYPMDKELIRKTNLVGSEMSDVMKELSPKSNQ